MPNYQLISAIKMKGINGFIYRLYAQQAAHTNETMTVTISNKLETITDTNL